MNDVASIATPPDSLLTALEPQPADALLALIGLHHRDPRSEKIDLGVGVYRDRFGRTPVMQAVKAAEEELLLSQKTKSYLGPEGDRDFVALLATIVFGSEWADADRLTGIQTPGGTGALRLGAELIARATPHASVWIGTPTWPNHAPIFKQAGLHVVPHAFFDPDSADLDFAGMMTALATMPRGATLLVHGCCHNPTGTGFTPEQWRNLAHLIAARGVMPFVDLAYQGLGDAPEADAAGMRALLRAVPEALVAYSCDKNFGLYRDRVGALWVQAAASASVARVTDNLLVLARSLWSMPPDHGAAIVRIILGSPVLTGLWLTELAAMCGRINALRTMVAATHPRLEPIGRQRGMFAMLPITADDVADLRAQHGVYMASSGRINLCGLQDGAIARFAGLLTPYLNR